MRVRLFVVKHLHVCEPLHKGITHNGTMTHQSGITALGTTDHVYLELDLVQGKDPKEAIGRLAAAINLPTTVGANAVVGVRPELWAKVSDAQYVPNDVHGFNEPLKGTDGYEMPATQHDAWVWVASFSRSQAFEVSSYVLSSSRGTSSSLMKQSVGPMSSTATSLALKTAQRTQVR